MLIQEPVIEMMRTSSDERPTKKMKTSSFSEYYIIGPSTKGTNERKLSALEQVLNASS